eukprot:c7419_g1_i3.p1 GENE.c7419_g1_i3~~c7419_g1_i3.p1  ORF type:complete len:397 (-),score=98.89 c7419_g1_i3:138-1328(-)
MPNPLVQLRDTYLSGRRAELKIIDGQRFIELGKELVSADTQVHFKANNSGMKNFAIGALWYLLEKKELAEKTFSTYYVEAGRDKFPKVSFLELKDVMSVLNGETEIDDIGSHDDVGVGSKRKSESVSEAQQPQPVVEGTTAVTESSQQEKEAPTEDAPMPTKKRATDSVNPAQDVANHEHSILTESLAKERLLFDRNTVLDHFKVKDFSFVLEELHNIRWSEQARVKQKEKEMHLKAKQPQMPLEAKDPILANDDAFLKDIDTTGSFTAVLSNTSTTPFTLPVPTPTPTPTNTPTTSIPRSIKPSEAPKSTPSQRVLHPIIMVPQASSTLINLQNIRDFLELGVFISLQTKMDSLESKPTEVRLRRRYEGGTSISYDVFDNPGKMRPEDWCVNVCG